MLRIRKAHDRGYFDHGWLRTYHTFSFGDYRDPAHTHFRTLRVINEDFIQPGAEFPTHPHRDMEIISYIMSGALTHQDNMGNTATISAGETQRMTAGRGIFHSESNRSSDQPVHMFQVWIFPERKDLDPEYEQRAFPDDTKRNRLLLIASPDGNNGSLSIHQDSRLFCSILEPGRSLDFLPETGRHQWLQLARGDVAVNGSSLKAGDGLAISDESRLHIEAGESEAEFLFFDLA